MNTNQTNCEKLINEVFKSYDVPIMKCHVEQKIYEKIYWEVEERNEIVIELNDLWFEFGFTNSLQTIIKESGFKDWIGYCDDGEILDGTGGQRKTNRLADPNARNLIEFISNLNLR